MLFRSFRWRLLIASVLGSSGLLAITHLVSVMLVRKYRVQLHLGSGTLLLVFSVVCVIAAISQIQSGLGPFDKLREHLAAVREGRAPRLNGVYPSEVQPLVNDLNAFLDHREEIVRRAVAKAGDLAHGLKTPLAVLTQEADRVAAEGQSELAEMLLAQVERMKRQVDYHLAHARAAASGATAGARCELLVAAEGLARTLRRLHAGRGVEIELHVSPEHVVRAEREDVDEMLGNLLDNACKWARTRVTLTSSDGEGIVTMRVEDDGPGLDPALYDRVLQRGVRIDQAAPGSGLGLAIVRDLAELYGGTVTLDRAAGGGLAATLTLPSVRG
jgi:signal transduction histidine kinase